MTTRGRFLAGILALALHAGFLPSAAPPSTIGSLQLRIEDAGGKVLPARVHLYDEAGKPQRPAGLPFWRDHFVCNGEVKLSLPVGKYRYEVERGPEHTRATGSVALLASGASVRVRLKRIADLARDGWYGGDLHVHRPVADVPLLMRAEDLHVAGVITWWNARNPWRTASRLPEQTVVSFDGGRWYDLMGGEDERGGGALLYFRTRSPLDITAAKREYPSSLAFLKQARKNPGAWVDVEKPFWWDVPAWLASGQVDSIGIAHNHMNRGGVMDNEAWGRPRVRDRYPGASGNGLYSQEIYYHALNTGLRLPPSAGSASGVLPNPVGYNRVYVHTGKKQGPDAWWAGLKAGRAFVTNGPLLLARAGGEMPGHIFRSERELAIEVRVEVTGNDPIRALEIVRDGEVVKRLAVGRTAWKGSLGNMRFERSGWLLVRAIADVTSTFRFASTAPWYVEAGRSPRTVHRRSVDFFLDWTKQRRASLKRQIKDEKQRAEVLKDHEQAATWWQELRKKAVEPR
jgi:hypothetical protein